MEIIDEDESEDLRASIIDDKFRNPMAQSQVVQRAP
jgi:hypothetical protein